MTPVGAVMLLAIAFSLRDWQARFPWLLGLSLTLPITAVVVLPGIQLTSFFLVLLVLSLLLGWIWVRGHIDLFSWPGAVILLALVGWTVVITLAGPSLFNGITVLNNRPELDGRPGPVALVYTGSNVAQPVYLILSGLLICFLATRVKLSPHVLLPGLVGCMGLSFWRLLSDKIGLPFPAGLVDSGNYAYIDIDTVTSYRLRGVFTEPSTLAHYATATLALCLVMLYSRQRFRWVYAVLAVVSAVNIVFAHSGTALVGGGLVLAITAVLITVRAARTGRGLTTLSVTACLVVVAGLVFLPTIQGYVTEIFFDKVDSDSYLYRTSADAFSLQLFLDVKGLGVGLGSTGSSSLWPTLLSTIGIIGTGLYAALVVTLVWRSSRTATGIGAAVVVTSLIVTKSVAGAFPSEPLLMIGLACCAQAAAQSARSRSAPDDAPTDPTPGIRDKERVTA